jgi:hypothetical protein
MTGSQLLTAARQGDTGTVSTLLSLPGVQSFINYQDAYGATPFFGAAAYGHSAVTKQLLAASCNVDLRSEMGTALQVAQRQGHIGVTILIQRNKKQKWADRLMKNVQANPEKPQKLTEDADRAMRELLAEEARAAANAAALSQKRKQAKSQKKRENAATVAAAAAVKDIVQEIQEEEERKIESAEGKGTEDCLELEEAALRVDVKTASTAALGPQSSCRPLQQLLAAAAAEAPAESMSRAAAPARAVNLFVLNSEVFQCPLTMEVMTDPVMTVDGQTYERKEIERWFALGNRTSPLTGAELFSKNLTPNIALRNVIQDSEKVLWC